MEANERRPGGGGIRSGELNSNVTALLLDGLIEKIVTDYGGLVCPCALHPAADEQPTENQMTAALLRARRRGLVVPSGRRHPVMFSRPGVRQGSTCLIWRSAAGPVGTCVTDTPAEAPDGTLGARRGTGDGGQGGAR